MDKWKESELEKMKAGGNRRMKQFLEDRDESTLPIRTKYNTKAASLYKDKVKCSFNTHLSILHDYSASEFAQMCFNTTQFLL